MQAAQHATGRGYEEDEYLTVAEAAQLLRLSRSTIYANADALGAIRVGKLLRIPRAALRARPGT